MMVTFGEPGVYSSYSNPLPSTDTWEDCLEYCLGLSTCVAVYNNNCQMFEIGQISTATSTSETKIAFKFLADNATCPIQEPTSLQGHYFTNTTYQPYTVSYSAPTWTFANSTQLECPTNYALFVRDLGPWCMKVIQHYACCNKTIAATMCNSYGAQLSGLDSTAEYDFMLAGSWPIFKNVTTNKIGSTQYYATGVWVDGARTLACMGNTTYPCNTTQAFSFTDPTLSSPPGGYLWLPGRPDGGDAPADGIVLNLYTTELYGMEDTPSSEPVSGVYCWMGYLCGAVPT
ncbi:PAN-3 domain-containing protein [Caenorhabditis elegans]|uniref:PAN-3 domain-containing protein n=1 Tax=Caenorhabditis elegans TaxID=6239 RepID=Q9XTS6_CAEEL|nr:PAN-3 domain-containing protein [Caenorhabditis elegans]CAB16308.1 PAN-3 domain-containing protein [Caenorhabditis elegans]|eukprot:NP_493450.1 C-type LECtin [Caenorhabditis elegans]